MIFERINIQEGAYLRDTYLRGLIQIGLGYLRRALFELNIIREGFIQREFYLKGYFFEGALIGVETIRKTYFKGALF